MTDRPEGGQTSWYDVTIAGKRFHIASRHGEGHIRQVERLLEEIYREAEARLQGQMPLNVALLTCLNLADQLLQTRLAMAEGMAPFEQRLMALSDRLDATLGPAGPTGLTGAKPGSGVETKDTAAVYES